jgi:DNA-binding NtrC family response regulator
VSPQPAPCILLVERDILVRNPLADYLRDCGYRVIEAVDAAEAREVLGAAVDVALVLADASTPEEGGFALRAWIRENHREIEVILAGSVTRAVAKAGEICNDGPAVFKPFDHRSVLDTIRRLIAARDRNQPAGS